MPDMSEARLRGTPVPSRRGDDAAGERRDERPQPQRNSQGQARSSGPSEERGPQAPQSRNAPSEASSTPTLRDSPAPNAVQQRREQPSDADLKARAAAAVARTRIVADPSITSAFRPDVDRDLYDLFVR
ncbi:hypothetical protein JCM8202_002743 [Rhodotorula sphaerocarpa]